MRKASIIAGIAFGSLLPLMSPAQQNKYDTKLISECANADTPSLQTKIHMGTYDNLITKNSVSVDIEFESCYKKKGDVYQYLYAFRNNGDFVRIEWMPVDLAFGYKDNNGDWLYRRTYLDKGFQSPAIMAESSSAPKIVQYPVEVYTKGVFGDNHAGHMGTSVYMPDDKVEK